MLHFDSDYMEGAHPLILQRLMETNLEQTAGYGTDPFCQRAKERIQAACGCPEAQIYFLVGGTQTNATVIGAVLRSYEGVISAETGHIHVHEAGAVEALGHKILALPQKDGKLSPKDVREYLERFYADGTHEHMVKPGMVYISHPTEYGTLYTLDELEQLHQICGEYHIPLFMDGARLGYGLASYQTDVTLEDVARCCDVFYIGGTKVGALFGEAVVIPRPGLVEGFFTTMKQRGALLAKGRLLGIQFETLFTDQLYWKISRHAIDLACRLREGLAAKGYSFFLDSPTNQQFVILENQKLEQLSAQVTFSIWEPLDKAHTVVRFATSWATTPEAVEELIELM